ncbi:hypothetical protein [Terrarubrum flagellatum]|uniref:hypothetical protein n=1 Tax=Terrirubrum flagellatum TaxID=2895980 RepID=UPI003144D733
MKLKEKLSTLSAQLRQMGANARRDIDAIRAKIEAAKQREKEIEIAPVDDAEIERRARRIVDFTAQEARAGRAFAIFGSSGKFSENNAWVHMAGFKPLYLAAILDPERLVKVIVNEAKAATADYSRLGQLTEAQRATELNAIKVQIARLEMDEEAAIRALASAGLVVERRNGATDLSHLEDRQLE